MAEDGLQGVHVTAIAIDSHKSGPGFRAPLITLLIEVRLIFAFLDRSDCDQFRACNSPLSHSLKSVAIFSVENIIHHYLFSLENNVFSLLTIVYIGI